MKGKIVKAIMFFVVGILIILAVGWFFQCQCVDLKAFTPAAIRDYILSFGQWAVVVYILAYALNTISILPPIAPLSLAAGLVFGAVWGSVYLMIAALIGTSMTFAISRFWGRKLADKILQGKFKDLDDKLEKNGFLTILFLRAIPLVPYEVLNYASGLSKIRFKDYFLATFLGLIPGVVIAAFFGGSLGDIKTFKDIFSPKLLIAVGLMALIIAVPTIYQMIKNRESK